MNHRTKQRRPKLSPAQKEAIYALPLSMQFHIVHIDTESGFSVYQHQLVDDQAPDYWQILEVAKAYALETDCWFSTDVFSPRHSPSKLGLCTWLNENGGLIPKRIKTLRKKHAKNFIRVSKTTPTPT